MLKGRLGLEGAGVPQADRHGVLWLGRGALSVEAGTLRFVTAGDGDLRAGDYAIPFQAISCILLQPGTSVTHDALRLLARHGTGLVVIGTDGVRCYASMPFGPHDSRRARRHAEAWADPHARLNVARRMYGWRLGELFPASDIAVLRGVEGARMKVTYAELAKRFGIEWRGRRYNRAFPELADPPNQAINHAASAVEGLALVAVAVTGVIPSLGFIHEDSSNAFTLDLADLFRDQVTIPVAFAAVRDRQKNETIDRAVRRLAGRAFRKSRVIEQMIERVKALFGDDERRAEAEAPDREAGEGRE